MSSDSSDDPTEGVRETFLNNPDLVQAREAMAKLVQMAELLELPENLRLNVEETESNVYRLILSKIRDQQLKEYIAGGGKTDVPKTSFDRLISSNCKKIEGLIEDIVRQMMDRQEPIRKRTREIFLPALHQAIWEPLSNLGIVVQENVMERLTQYVQSQNKGGSAQL